VPQDIRPRHRMLLKVWERNWRPGLPAYCLKPLISPKP